MALGSWSQFDQKPKWARNQHLRVCCVAPTPVVFSLYLYAEQGTGLQHFGHANALHDRARFESAQRLDLRRVAFQIGVRTSRKEMIQLLVFILNLTYYPFQFQPKTTRYINSFRLLFVFLSQLRFFLMKSVSLIPIFCIRASSTPNSQEPVRLVGV